MSEHTKGPWHIGIGNGIGSVFGPENCRANLTDDGTALAPICMMVRGFGGIVHRNKFPAEDIANAKLIAAAPELLEACKATLSIIGIDDIRKARLKAEAAVAKAT